MLALIDTDPGIDDALALLYAWGSPGLRLAGITTVAGNVDVEEATRNLFRLIVLRRPSPPPVVAQGAAAPLARPLVTARGGPPDAETRQMWRRSISSWFEE